MNDPSGIKDAFFEESRYLVSEMETLALDLESEPGNTGIADSLFRAVHTIKGSSGMFGFENAAELGHALENIIASVRDGALKAGKEITDIFLECADEFKVLYENKDIELKTALRIKDKIAVLAESVTGPGKKEQKKQNVLNEYRIFFRPMEKIFEIGLDPYTNIEELIESGECTIECDTANVPDLFEINPEKSYLSFDIRIKTMLSLKEIKDIFLFVEDDSEIIIEEIHSTIPEKTEDISDKLNKYIGKKDSSIAISTKKLDDMVNLVGELVMNQSRLYREMSLRPDDPLKELAEAMEESVQELRSSVLDLRMTPIGTKFSHFRRLVRDLSASLDKKVELYTYGEDTELDKSIIEKIWDPFVHLIRNSIDHGIESPEERLKKGKSETGRIVISARTKESRVEISISDDGKGLDEDFILEQAVKRGFADKTQNISKNNILDFIFIPGFTTAEKVSGISGRGIGMDAVKKKIDEVNGEIRIDSVKGCGTTITILLPLTLAIVDVLMFETGNMCFAVPLSHIEECFDFSRYKIEGQRKRNLLKLRDEFIPYFKISDIYSLEESSDESFWQVIVVDHGKRKAGFVVERLLRAQQAVIKSIRNWYNKDDGITGAAVLYDGSLAYVLDVIRLLNICAGKKNQDTVSGAVLENTLKIAQF
ncbi:MAG: chemotaxis protein CheA [Desulfobacteraceae bacterium]|nr:chemotaxis protein CheA [Desulfobacteraceae bacterium]MCB9494298.1 chemotaxis protein CheA [Desulfobacteraceae bacterium]